MTDDKRKAAGMALAAKRGEITESELSTEAKEMYDTMSEEQLMDILKGQEGQEGQEKGQE
ncbi:MAG: DUF3008 family protein [bacterium]|nr:DUF3008 family protein [bacterium]